MKSVEDMEREEMEDHALQEAAIREWIIENTRQGVMYAIQPIDFWSGWRKPDEFFSVYQEEHENKHTSEAWNFIWDAAKKCAREAGWQGDICEGPFVSVLPEIDYYLPPFLVAWKQGQKGTTFIYAPYDLPWIAREADVIVYHRDLRGGTP